MKDYVFLWLVCFGKKTIIDLTYYHINWLRYLRYSLVLLAIDLAVVGLEMKNIKSKSLLNIKPFKAFLLLTSGICDSISLENLLWRNHINGWHLDVSVFIFGNPLLVLEQGIIKFSRVGPIFLCFICLVLPRSKEGEKLCCLPKKHKFWSVFGDGPLLFLIARLFAPD